MGDAAGPPKPAEQGRQHTILHDEGSSMQQAACKLQHTTSPPKHPHSTTRPTHSLHESRRASQPTLRVPQHSLCLRLRRCSRCSSVAARSCGVCSASSEGWPMLYASLQLRPARPAWPVAAACPAVVAPLLLGAAPPPRHMLARHPASCQRRWNRNGAVPSEEQQCTRGCPRCSSQLRPPASGVPRRRLKASGLDQLRPLAWALAHRWTKLEHMHCTTCSGWGYRRLLARRSGGHPSQAPRPAKTDGSPMCSPRSAPRQPEPERFPCARGGESPWASAAAPGPVLGVRVTNSLSHRHIRCAGAAY